MAEAAASFIAEQVGVPAACWIKRQLSYVFNFKSHVEKSNTVVRHLKLDRERIKRDVEGARRRLEGIHSDVEGWLEHVTTIDEDAEHLLEETERAKKGCFFGFCPNMKARYQLSKNAEKISKAAADLLLAEQHFPSVSYCPAPQGLRFVAINDFEAFESRACHLEEIKEALKDPNVNMIGVWGMGGVGKTTIVKKAAEQAIVDGIFNVVIFSEVSLNQDLERIQGEIAEALHFKLEAETISGRSNKLRERLQEEKKILVILDNIWARLDLGELGIPVGDDHKGCKILMTSRDERVLTDMCTSRNISVGALDDGEAGNLFEKMAGDVVKARNLKPLAIEIAKRCAGLPILIVTVARALRNKNDSRTWKVALRQLEKFESKEFDEQVYSTLELSYNHLKSDVIRQLFLLCGLLVNTDYAIEDLFIYCMSLDSFKDLGCLEDRRDELHKSVEDLRSSCMLLDGEKNGYIKMHDVVRKFAVSFARKNHNMFIGDYGGELQEWPEKNTVARYSTICFPHNYIHRLLEGLQCEELKFFILHSKNRDLEIPSSFFQRVRGITVLVIKNIKIPTLPSSLRNLENLHTLSLEGCTLEDISIIENLVGLENLCISNTHISHLPEAIKQLTRLKLFSVSGCHHLKVIPPNAISSLSRLEELSMEESFVNWEAEGVHRQNACLAELNKLSKLTSLDIHIPNSHIIMPNDLFFVKLERFKILIGDDWDWEWSSEYESSRRLKLKLSTSIHLKHGVKELLKKTEDLYLHEVGGVNSVSELDSEGFPQLRYLHVQRGCNFQYIVNKGVHCDIFPGLEVLSLENLINLEMICQGQLGVESFSELRIVTVEGCDTLKNLFSFSIAKSLLQLQKIKVEKCENIEEIFSCESEEDGNCNVIELRKVHFLRLGILPKITSFCSEVKNVQQKLQTADSSGSSQNMQLMMKDEPIPFLNGKIVFPNLEKLSLSSIGAEKIWDNSLLAMPRCFETLRHLEVVGCNKLKFLFPVSVISSLIQLEKLRVFSCDLVEEIIEGGAGSMIFPKLHDLRLNALPKLKRFCTGNSIEFPSLFCMRIRQCDELKSFIFDEKEVSNDDLPPPLFDEKVKLPFIETLIIESVNQLKRIWHNELAPESFCKLFRLWLDSCKNLPNIFQSNMLTRLQNLRELWIFDCKSMDVIFDLEEPNALEMHITKAPIFRKLKSITIHDCQSLRYICNCMVVENIVATEEAVDLNVKFEFPKVTSLSLNDLPKLRSFYPGIHTSEWPLLKTLNVLACDKLEIFASESSNIQDGAHDEYISETSVEQPQPFFCLEKEIFPNLKTMYLSGNYSTKQMWHGEFRPEMFCRLNYLRVTDVHDEMINSFPPGFLKKLPNLEELHVENSAFNEIFPNGGVIGEAAELSTFCSLKILRVKKCYRLKILFPSSLLSFCNLIELNIEYCDGLTYLMSSSTAKSMMQLQKLKVWGCKMMTSIVECVGEGEAEDDIIFHQLKRLDIFDMPNLSSFCGSGKHAFKFPSLEEAIVGKCPSLKTFCEGPLSTSKLQSVTVDGEEKRWNGHLNTTIQTLYKEMMAIRIQRQFRRHVARRHFIELRMASIIIQSAVRGNNARNFFESLKGDTALN